jgi:hypothetical protein
VRPSAELGRSPRSSHRGGRWSTQPPLRLAPHAASGARQRSCPCVLDRGLPEASLAGAVVQPAQRPALSLMNTLTAKCGDPVHCRAFKRTSALLVVYHTHTTDGRGHCSHGPRPEQSQLDPVPTITMVLRTRFGLIQDREKKSLMQLAFPDVSGNRYICRS